MQIWQAEFQKDSAEERLRGSGIATGWMGESLRSLSGRAAELAVRTAGKAEIEALAADLAAFQARAARATELSGRLMATLARISAETARVEATRREMGTALGLPLDLLLREKGADPSERMTAAAFEAGEARARIGQGELEEAAEALERADWQATEAAVIVEASRRTFESRESAVEEGWAETERIAALVPEPEREEVASARGKLDRAIAEIRAGRMLAAASLFRQMRGHQEKARYRLAEITELGRRDR